MEKFKLAQLDATDIEQFMTKVKALTPTECWRWFGSSDGQGYPVFWVPGIKRLISAKRVLWCITHNDDFPENHQMKSTCGNTWCVNPEHLVAVQTYTAAERSAMAEDNRQRKFNESIIRHNDMMRERRARAKPEKPPLTESQRNEIQRTKDSAREKMMQHPHWQRMAKEYERLKAEGKI